ncbi:MAG: hypothetical protein HC849_06055 [Oscillatoriales cyanobacterium RU_3_3]|nr:hypothetical protein [Microcoleus sp. SU_5_6]NJL66721.1 hypothetical protein [Microcoleus sp. SM1_3_4]NJM59850.1 hypothetical protein [Oscillatoriales cyanobacterium RU_3_3]NJR23174.1 hypothetical protein [Richelia sp. CSU_2_1]
MNQVPISATDRRFESPIVTVNCQLSTVHCQLSTAIPVPESRSRFTNPGIRGLFSFHCEPDFLTGQGISGSRAKCLATSTAP